VLASGLPLASSTVASPVSGALSVTTLVATPLEFTNFNVIVGVVVVVEPPVAVPADPPPPPQALNNKAIAMHKARRIILQSEVFLSMNTIFAVLDLLL
jgi:hypothetical protein